MQTCSAEIFRLTAESCSLIHKSVSTQTGARFRFTSFSLAEQMDQYINIRGGLTILANAFLSPSYFIPHIEIDGSRFVMSLFLTLDVTHLRIDQLKSAGFQAVLLDKDNTITLPYEFEYPDSISVL